MLDAWLSDPQSRLLVVTVEDKPVALARVSWLTPEEAWIEGGRVVSEIPFLLEALSSAGYHPMKEHAFLVFKLDLRQVLSRISG